MHKEEITAFIKKECDHLPLTVRTAIHVTAVGIITGQDLKTFIDAAMKVNVLLPALALIYTRFIFNVINAETKTADVIDAFNLAFMETPKTLQ